MRPKKSEIANQGDTEDVSPPIPPAAKGSLRAKFGNMLFDRLSTRSVEYHQQERLPNFPPAQSIKVSEKDAKKISQGTLGTEGDFDEEQGGVMSEFTVNNKLAPIGTEEDQEFDVTKEYYEGTEAAQANKKIGLPKHASKKNPKEVSNVNMGLPPQTIYVEVDEKSQKRKWKKRMLCVGLLCFVLGVVAGTVAGLGILPETEPSNSGTSGPTNPPTPFPTPATGVPTVSSAPTQYPTTFPSENPTSSSPTATVPTPFPSTNTPTKSPASSPTTKSPTLAPTTQSPTTPAPTTKSPTPAPTTQSPTTAAPTTKSPTTASPTTASPTPSGVIDPVAKAAELCAHKVTTGSAGWCVDSTHYGQCNADGTVSKSNEPCNGTPCACPFFVRLTDRNPCSPQANSNDCNAIDA